VFYPALAGRPAQLAGRLDVPHTHTSVVDFGRALVVLGQHEAALGQAWHVPNDRSEITQGEIVRLIFAALGRPARMSAVPRWAMQLVGLFNPGARETVEMLYEFERPFVVDSSKFERAFGLRATPLPQALAQTVAWYQANPQAQAAPARQAAPAA
jgi:nucleoside-diphosphate-sugar epimerase